ncbi:hypothetical protein HMPREF0724_12205 [Prescottella equi ATCC 33707]|uniref:Uncharacterized protein n=1 Tax=Prescottella equi ATCC 33707 TaxID=525370 RepID=E9T0P6_RHOHA|nr:hypothetical protein HMPREF0724_12205 [Prescottella equi ATCC 33707]
MTESRMALVVGILTLITNIVMVIQNRKAKPKRRGRHRKR